MSNLRCQTRSEVHKNMDKELSKLQDKLELTAQMLKEERIGTTRVIRLLNALIDQAHDAILVRDVQGTILQWNEGAVKTYGFSKKEAIGKSIHQLLNTDFPDSIDQINEYLMQNGSWDGELVHTTSAGERIIVESRWALQTKWHNKYYKRPLTVLEINRDITALKAYIHRLELSNRELEEFAFIAAHDLQEPLRKIQTFCDLVMRRNAPALDLTGKEYLDKVICFASRMRKLLHDLLQFSRIAANPIPRKVELNSVVRMATNLPEESGFQIEIENLPAIEADESQMLILFQNLIANAIKFRNDRTPHIRVYSNLNTNGMYEIIIEDNGIGFEQQHAERIFRPFQRLNSRNDDGTGMGLTICRKIVEHHGGIIGAESVVGEGTKFIIRLPKTQLRLESATSRRNADQPSLADR